MTISIYSHPACLLHEMGVAHPESPMRLSAVLEALASEFEQPIKAALATREQLLLGHSDDYVDQVFAAAPNSNHNNGYAYLDPDTSMNAHSLEATLAATGAVIAAVDFVCAQTNHQAFCAVRPPGHHAVREGAMGFCIFNAIAIGAKYAVQTLGLQRVAVLDFDVHHGNGTEDILRGDSAMLFCSTFQSPYYPNVGESTPRPPVTNIINTPLPAGTSGAAFRDVILRDWLPALATFKPQLILVSAGFDAHKDDPLAYLNLTENDYAWLGETLGAQANIHCEGRLVAVMEGGYNTIALAKSVCAFLKGLTDKGLVSL